MESARDLRASSAQRSPLRAGAGAGGALTSVRSVSLVWKTVDQNQALRET